MVPGNTYARHAETPIGDAANESTDDFPCGSPTHRISRGRKLRAQVPLLALPVDVFVFGLWKCTFDRNNSIYRLEIDTLALAPAPAPVSVVLIEFRYAYW